MRTIETTTSPKTAAQNVRSYWDAVVSAELRKGEDPLDESGPSIEIVAADKVGLDGMFVNWILSHTPILGSRGVRLRWLMNINHGEPVAKHVGTLDGARNKARQIIDGWQGIIDGTTEVKRVSN